MLLAAFWGPTFLLIKIGVEAVSPLALTTVRCGSAALFLLGYCLLTQRSLSAVFPSGKHLLFMAIFGNVVPFLCCAIGETMVQSSTAGIIEGSVPLIVALFTALFTPHRRLSKNEILGIAIGFLGILTIFAPDIMQTSGHTEERFLGKMFLVVMAVSFAASFVYSKEKLDNVPHIAAVTVQLILSGLILFLMTFFIEGRAAFHGFTFKVSAVALSLGIFGTAIPWCIYFHLIKKGSAAQVSLAVYLLPVVAVFLGWVFLDETLRWNLWLGVALILFSLILASGMLAKRRKTDHDNPLLRN
ncbi:putative membrane protein [Waddlia chondrophila WSU 86-1044]|uniref:Putative membrane protein n=1 Tax=Waddlia chondrophila (strain ATCC VR-1470 / WSU 86-1044) TaxID=716544 RepID=D6YVU7_WADCW|nr:putative membrane protein [Waddlia chondrophila WSU 86-1044]